MHYNRLRIKLVKDGDPEVSTFLQNVVSVLANTFVIKNSNSKRKGVMYFEHLPKQSFVNYIIKTTFSGIASSVGAASNGKYRKKYNRALKKNKRPEVNLF